MDILLIYHGSTEVIELPEIRKQRYNKDFYWGFYCAIMEEQARRWATRFRRSGYINVYSFDESNSLKTLKFSEMNDNWLDFIADCRSGKSHDYDIVEGAMADETIFNYVQDYIDGRIDREQFWVLAKFKYPTHQISFNTAKALDTLKFERSYVCDVQKK